MAKLEFHLALNAILSASARGSDFYVKLPSLHLLTEHCLLLYKEKAVGLCAGPILKNCDSQALAEPSWEGWTRL